MNRLKVIKLVHTLIWIFFNIVIFYLFYAGITNTISGWVWIGLLSFAIEGIVLLVFRMKCPLTILARRYTDSQKDNFDIFLPNWLAKYTKMIYGTLLLIAICIIVYRFIQNQ